MLSFASTNFGKEITSFLSPPTEKTLTHKTSSFPLILQNTTQNSTPMASSSTPPPPAEAIDSRNWVELPRDVTAMILKKVGVMDLLQSAQKVCMAWRSVSKDPDMWRSIQMSGYFGEDMWDEMGYDVEKMATHAIDRSCGQLVEFSIKGFGSNELLDYIGER